MSTATDEHFANCFLQAGSGGLIDPSWCSANFVDVMVASPAPLLLADVIRPELLLAARRRAAVYFAPFDWVNREAKVILVGLTPGVHQAHIALATAAHHLRAGATINEALSKASRAASFAGPMRANMVKMLDGIDLPRHLWIQSASQLFGDRSDLLATTSVICHPVFVKDKDGKDQNYGGGVPKIDREPLLAAFAAQVLAAEPGGGTRGPRRPARSCRRVGRKAIANRPQSCARRISSSLRWQRLACAPLHPSPRRSDRCRPGLVFLSRHRQSARCRPKSDGICARRWDRVLRSYRSGNLTPSSVPKGNAAGGLCVLACYAIREPRFSSPQIDGRSIRDWSTLSAPLIESRFPMTTPTTAVSLCGMSGEPLIPPGQAKLSSKSPLAFASAPSSSTRCMWPFISRARGLCAPSRSKKRSSG